MIKDRFKNCQFVDLTHTLCASIPTWDGSCGFKHTIENDYPIGCRTHLVNMKAGIGTHMDAPSHFIPNALSISEIPIDKLIIPACVIDISEKNDPSYMLSEADIQFYENQYGIISKNSLVIAYTGWDKYWMYPDKYRNLNENGQMQFPGFSKHSVEILIDREIVGIGIDTLSPDGSDMNFPVHHIMLGSGRYIIENLKNCDKLPAFGASVLVLPMKIQEGTEAPIRAIAIF